MTKHEREETEALTVLKAGGCFVRRFRGIEFGCETYEYVLMDGHGHRVDGYNRAVFLRLKANGAFDVPHEYVTAVPPRGPDDWTTHRWTLRLELR
jgi:hypothetical protein